MVPLAVPLATVLAATAVTIAVDVASENDPPIVALPAAGYASIGEDTDSVVGAALGTALGDTVVGAALGGRTGAALGGTDGAALGIAVAPC